MIDTTIGALLNIKPFLQNLANTEMPAKDAFKVLKVLKAVDKEYEIVHEARLKLLESYAEKDAAGQWKVDSNGNVTIPVDSIEAFNKEQYDLLGTALSLNCDKLSISLLENLQFSPKALLDLEDFINFE